ncbi:hypothetical protein [Granulicella paludicola]|uniref:hypothetical protein n=1 Tax=Granulicella paludicola TaxID=474951 RepID=UPI0021E0DE7A|nr:hypothetical protein [Granulicella paludicola]
MTDREIIPIPDPKEQSQQAATAVFLRDFLDSNRLPDEMPACPVGMKMLFEMARRYPSAFEIARQRRFIDPPPTVVRTMGWKAYCEHVMGCVDCG